MAGMKITRGLGVVMWGATVDDEEVGKDEGEPVGSEGAEACDLVSLSKIITRRTIAILFEITAMKPACLAVESATKTVGRLPAVDAFRNRWDGNLRNLQNPDVLQQTARSTDWDASGMLKSKCSKPMGRDSRGSPKPRCSA